MGHISGIEAAQPCLGGSASALVVVGRQEVDWRPPGHLDQYSQLGVEEWPGENGPEMARLSFHLA